MTLQTKTFEQMVQDQTAAIQSASKQLVDTSVGSIMRSAVDANAGSMGLWLQAEMQRLLAITRAMTSKGVDLDSWMAQFNFPREKAEPSSGKVTYSRRTATQQAVLIANTDVTQTTKAQTANGLVVFNVVVDTSNPNYSATAGGYVVPANTASIDVPVVAQIAGTAGNVLAGEIDTLFGSTPGFDTVTNAQPFTNGKDTESDEDYRARFILYLAGLAKASIAAIKSAIANVRAGIEQEIVECVDYATGDPRKGYFYVVVDDGSGDPKPELLQSIYNAIDATRACGIQFEQHKPIALPVTITLTVTRNAHYAATDVKNTVENAIKTYVNGLKMGETLYYNFIARAAIDSLPEGAIINVSNVLANGGTADIASSTKQSLVPTVTATVA